MHEATTPSGTGTGVRRALSVVATGIAVVVGFGLVLMAVTVGDCSAFGGRCPSEPGPLLDDDVFGMAALGGALASGVPVFLARPSRRRVPIAIAVAATAAVVVGLMARAAASG